MLVPARARIGAVRAAALPAEAGVSPSSASALLPLLRRSRAAEIAEIDQLGGQ